MTSWTPDELAKVGTAEELQIESRRGDGSLRKPVTIWVVREGDDLYVRAAYGRESAWFRGAQERHEGRIRAGGVVKEVQFVEVDAADSVNDAIDAVYRSKYHRYAASIIESIVNQKARAATIHLVAV